MKSNFISAFKQTNKQTHIIDFKFKIDVRDVWLKEIY